MSAVAEKNAGLVKIDRKSLEWHRGLIAIPVLEVNSRGVDGWKTGRRMRRRQWNIAHSTDLRSISTSPAVFVHGSAHLGRHQEKTVEDSILTVAGKDVIAIWH